MYWQLFSNNMKYYFNTGDAEIHKSPNSLFSLRADLHSAFDQSQFVIVPNFGKFAVHYLRSSQGTASLYHNIIFDHGGQVSSAALYVRFAWALTNIVKDFSPSKNFRFEDDDPASGPRGRADEDERDDDPNDDPKQGPSGQANSDKRNRSGPRYEGGHKGGGGGDKEC